MQHHVATDRLERLALFERSDVGFVHSKRVDSALPRPTDPTWRELYPHNLSSESSPIDQLRQQASSASGI
jgi:hypothetical protein